jgi:NAD(P)-dependent dehydrogenase (short-subunit alcohol dehydrogenase family)
MIDRREPLEGRYGPWALVTGASEGIGKSFAAALAQQGFHLVLVARRSHLLDALAASLAQAHGTQCDVLTADLSTAEGVAEVLDRTARRRFRHGWALSRRRHRRRTRHAAGQLWRIDCAELGFRPAL